MIHLTRFESIPLILKHKYMNLQIRSNVSYHGWSKGLYCVFADIRSRSTLLSCPLVNGRPNWASSIPLSWWYTWLHGTGSTFSGWALESFIPLSFERAITILSSAPTCYQLLVQGGKWGGGRLLTGFLNNSQPEIDILSIGMFSNVPCAWSHCTLVLTEYDTLVACTI